MTGNAIPDAALRQHIAFLGKTGSGKTSTAKLAVEQILRENPAARICVLDPIKSDWWGLTSSASGRSAGLPFYILGGPHGHVSLHDSAGKALGELVGSGALPLSIIDMADFPAGGLQKFFNDFAPALLKRIRGVVYLVIEEAHEFAPKERSGIGAETTAIHHAKKLATAGRSKGIRMMVLTQRTQSLHNALLGSCDTMIVHRLTAPADQAPVKAWLKGNMNKETNEAVSESLARLKTGTGWICSGEAQIGELVTFPPITTYDNSATPTGDEADHDIKTAPVDRERLRAIIGTAVKQAEQDDPRALRAEIARLTALTKAATNIPQNIPDEAAIAAAEKRGYAKAEAACNKSFLAAIGEIDYALTIARTAFNHVSGAFAPAQKSASAATARPADTTQARAPIQVPRKSSPAPSGDGALTNPQLTLLRSLAWWKIMGHSEPTRPQLAAICGWKPTGSNIKDRLSELMRLGLVTYPKTGLVALTGAGAKAAPEPDMSRTIVDGLREVLTGPQEKLFNVLLEHGDETERATLAVSLGWEPGGSNIKDRLSELSRLEIVHYPQRGTVALQSWVR